MLNEWLGQYPTIDNTTFSLVGGLSEGLVQVALFAEKNGHGIG